MQKKIFQNPKVSYQLTTSESQINIMWDTVITKYSGDPHLESLTLQNVSTKAVQTVPCGGLFLAIGHTPNTQALKTSGIRLDDEGATLSREATNTHIASGYVVARDNVYTNIEGVFACGDVVDKTYKQVASAVGTGCMAAIAAERWLEKRNRAVAKL